VAVRCGNKACKKYINKDSAVHAGVSYYCDSGCMFAKAPKKSKSKKSTNTPKAKPESFSEETRDWIWERDKGRCRLCGGMEGLAVHHVIYRSVASNKPYQNESSNGVLLCNQPCHLTIIHGNKKYYAPILLGLIWLSEVEGKYMTIGQFDARI